MKLKVLLFVFTLLQAEISFSEDTTPKCIVDYEKGIARCIDENGEEKIITMKTFNLEFDKECDLETLNAASKKILNSTQEIKTYLAENNCGEKALKTLRFATKEESPLRGCVYYIEDTPLPHIYNEICETLQNSGRLNILKINKKDTNLSSEEACFNYGKEYLRKYYRKPDLKVNCKMGISTSMNGNTSGAFECQTASSTSYDYAISHFRVNSCYKK